MPNIGGGGSSGFFVPSVEVARKEPGVIDVRVSASANNGCFRAGDFALELPPGMDASIPEHAHLVCRVQYTGGMEKHCLMVVTSLNWHCPDLNIGSGLSRLAVHVVVDNVLLGSTIVDLPSPNNA